MKSFFRDPLNGMLIIFIIAVLAVPLLIRYANVGTFSSVVQVEVSADRITGLTFTNVSCTSWWQPFATNSKSFLTAKQSVTHESEERYLAKENADAVRYKQLLIETKCRPRSKVITEEIKF